MNHKRTSHKRTGHKRTNSHLVIAGAGYAGLVAANRAAAKGHAVTLVNDREDFVDRIRLHEVIAGTRTPDRAVVPLAAAVRPGVRLVIDQVTAVRSGVVGLANGGTLAADHVIVATGSGAGSGGWEWAEKNRAAVAGLAPGAQVAVAGAGLTGIEVATEIAYARPDLRVALSDPLPVGAAYSEPGRRHLMRSLAHLGIHTAATTPDAADLLIDCTGFTRASLAAASGLPVTSAGALAVDACLRVSGHENLWAAGDAAIVAGHSHLRMACATAEPMAGLLVDQIGRADRGEPLRPVSIGLVARCVSLGRRDALVQYVRRDDTPVDRINRGRVAAAMKETVCRGARFAPIHLSRWYRELAGPANA